MWPGIVVSCLVKLQRMFCVSAATHCGTLVTHCNTLQHTKTHRNTLQPTCSTLATHLQHACNTLQHTIQRECGQILLYPVYSQVANKFLSLRCNTLQRNCNTVQRTASYCNALQHTATDERKFPKSSDSIATHCNSLKHTAAYYCSPLARCCNTCCNTLRQSNVCFCDQAISLQHTATHCNTLQWLEHTTTHCNTLQHTATNKSELLQSSHPTATRCNMVQHGATHYSTLQHTCLH